MCRVETVEHVDVSVADSVHEETVEIHLDPSQNTEPFACSECEYKCSYQNILNEHLKTHKKETSPTQFECSECDHKCSNKTELNEHMNVHSNVSESELENNGDTVNLEEIQDTIADNSAVQVEDNGNLDEQILDHTGEKPFFEGLKRHIASQEKIVKENVDTHEGENHFKCFKCEFTSSNKTELELHNKKTHRRKG